VFTFDNHPYRNLSSTEWRREKRSRPRGSSLLAGNLSTTVNGRHRCAQRQLFLLVKAGLGKAQFAGPRTVSSARSCNGGSFSGSPHCGRQQRSARLAPGLHFDATWPEKPCGIETSHALMQRLCNAPAQRSLCPFSLKPSAHVAAKDAHRGVQAIVIVIIDSS
jgi:hypothetical protein